jgi:hypothetical protein
VWIHIQVLYSVPLVFMSDFVWTLPRNHFYNNCNVYTELILNNLFWLFPLFQL